MPVMATCTAAPRSFRPPETVFDLLYDEYLPFRLYADFMLGASPKALADQFALSEDWVTERIKAMRWCLEKQVRLNLLDQQHETQTPAA